MRLSSFILATLVLIAASAALAQVNSDAATQWRSQMAAAKHADNDFRQLQDALKTAEPFGETDPRLFETLVQLTVVCQDDESDCEKFASGYMDRTLRLREKVRPTDAHLADLLMQLGPAVSAAERFHDAVLIYVQARDIRENLFGQDHQKVAEVWAAEAWVYQWQKDQTQARRTMQHALELRENSAGAGLEGLAELLDDSARLYAYQEDRVDAEKEYARAIAIRERVWKPSDARFVAALKNIADQNQWGDLKAVSGKLYRRIVEIQRSAHGERSEEYYRALFDLAQYFKSGQRFQEAEETFQSACAVRQRMGKKDLTAADCLTELARCRLARNHYADAVQAAASGLALRTPLEDNSALGSVQLYALLSEAYLGARDEQNSEQAFGVLTTAAVPKYRWLLISTAQKVGGIYQERGDYPRAAEKLEVAVAAMEAANSSDPRLPEQMLRLVRLYQTMGRTDDANRMNMAVIRLAAQKLQTGGKEVQRVAIIGVAILFAIPVVGVVGCGWLFGMLARKTDRELAPLFVEQPPEAQPPPLPEWTAAGTELTEPAPVEIDSQVVAVLLTPPPLPAAPTPAPSSQISLRAEGSDLFAMRVLNLLLSILTLGIYSFWGKAKVRHYVCGQAEFEGDRFAFHGTGRELLLGWLRALPALAFIFLFPSVLPLLWQHKYAIVAGQLAAVAGVVILWPIARVGAYRYRLNRMSWRGIRFSYRGAAWRYLTASMIGSLLSVLTLGVYVPFLQVQLERMLLNNTYFGDAPFQYSGRASDLLPAWLFALPLSICSMGIGYAWWSALQHRYNWAHTTFVGGRFRCDVSGAQLLRLWLGNALILIPTLGLGMSWVMLRTLRFWTCHIQLVGEIELAPVRQDARATSALGESFADFLGFDFGF